MNYLNGKVCYLTGPITDAKDDGVGWREKITGPLQQFGIVVDDPTKTTVGGAGEVGKDKELFKELLAEGKVGEVKERFWPIVRKDLRSVDRSDFLIFYCDTNAKMVGTVHELVIANLQRKPILMYIDKENLKNINPWLLVFVKNGCLFHSWQDMMLYLKEVDNGKYDTSYWTL